MAIDRVAMAFLSHFSEPNVLKAIAALREFDDQLNGQPAKVAAVVETLGTSPTPPYPVLAGPDRDVLMAISVLATRDPKRTPLQHLQSAWYWLSLVNDLYVALHALPAGELRRLLDVDAHTPLSLLRQWAGARSSMAGIRHTQRDQLPLREDEAKSLFQLARPLMTSDNKLLSEAAFAAVQLAVTEFPSVCDGVRLELLNEGWEKPGYIYYFDMTPAEQKAFAKIIEDSRGKDMWDLYGTNVGIARQAIVMGASDQLDKTFAKWAKDPDLKDGMLHPSSTRIFGRTLLKNGKLRELFFRTSFQLDVATGSPAKAERCVGPFDLDDVCDECGTPLFAVIAGDAKGPLRFLAKLGKRFAIPVCPVCIDENGRFSGSTDVTVAESQSSDPETKRLVIGRPISPIRGANSYSHYMGGLPKWLNDPDYRKCPACSRTMTFLACLDAIDLKWGTTRMLCFICEDCKTSTVIAEQD